MEFIKSYRGCFYPLLTVVALLLVLAFLSNVANLDDAVLPVPELTLVENYPDGLEFHEAVLVGGSGMKWLMFTYFYWLVGLATLGFCWFQLRNAITGFIAVKRYTIHGIYLGALAVTIAALVYATVIENTPLMSFAFLLENLELITGNLLQLATYNTALGYAALVALLVATALLLIPGTYHNNPTQQMRAITRLMYCGAAFLLIWIAQATEMYRFAATLLVTNQRQEVLDFAPTISLIVGVFASLLLGAAYLGAFAWLQGSYKRSQRQGITAEKETDTESPKQFVLTHWPKITAVLMPILPGVMGQVLQGLGQVVG